MSLNHIFSFLMRTCIQSTSSEKDLDYFVGHGTQHFWMAFARFPLNALVMSAQIDAGMWRLNGEMMEQQNNNYKLIPLCYHKRDLDITALQLTAAHLRPDTLLLNLAYAFGITDFLHDSTAQLKVEHRLPMLKALLQLLATLTTELPVPTHFIKEEDGTEWTSERYEFRRDIIHRLAAGAATFSQLTECSTPTCIGVAADSTETELEKLLAAIGRQVGSPANRLKPITYELSDDMWQEFNPFYHHLAPADREEARERWIRNRRGAHVQPDEPTHAFFPGDAKLSGDKKLSPPLSAIERLPTAHPVFDGMRDAFVRSKLFSVLIQTVIRGCVYHLLTSSEGAKVPKYFVDLYSDTLESFRQSWNSGTDTSANVNKRHSGSDELLSLALFLLTVQLRVISREKKFKCYYVTRESRSYKWSAPSENRPDGNDTFRDANMVLSTLMEEWDGTMVPVDGADDAVHKSTSTLSCLLILWHGGRAILERSNLESIRWILSELHERSERCKVFMEKVHMCHSSQAPKSKSKMKRSSRKRKAQKHMMEKMKQHQQQWMKQYSKELSDSKSVSSTSSTFNPSNTEEVLECVTCREVSPIKDGDFVMLGILQHSQVLRKHVKGKCVSWCTENTGMIQLCGHAMHPHCLATYVSSLVPFNARGNGDAARREFLCPLCKSASNLSVPAVPHLRQSLQLELGKCCSDAQSIEAAFQSIIELDVGALPKKSVGSAAPSHMKWLRNYMNLSVKLCSANPEDLRQLLRSRLVIQQSSEYQPPLDEIMGTSVSTAAYTIVVHTTFANKYGDGVVPASDLNSVRRVLRAIDLFIGSDGSEVLKKLIQQMKNMFACGNVSQDSFLLREDTPILQCSTEMLLLVFLLNNADPSVIDALLLLRLCQALYDYTPTQQSTTVGSRTGLLSSLRHKLITESSGPLAPYIVRGSVSEEDLRAFVSADMTRFFQFAKVAAACCQSCETEVPLQLSLDEEFPEGVLPVVLRAGQHVLGNGNLLRKLEEWVVRYKFSIGDTADVARDMSRALDVNPLVRLGHSYTELYSRVHAGTCSDCKGPTHDRAVCLLCGESLLAGSHEAREFLYTHVHELNESQYGECTKHAMEKHAGVGVLFLFSKPCILLIKGTKAAYWPSIYTDQYGEDQRAAPRSLPMFFDEERFRQVEKMWLEHKLAYEVTSRRNKATFTITQGYY